MAPIRLLALDVDGTLLRSDGTVAEVDRQAIAAALARGIGITLSTDRFVTDDDPVGGAPITAIGVGPADAVTAVHEALLADPGMPDDLAVFPIRTTEHWVVRLSPGGCSKAVGLANLADRLGIACE